MKKVKDAIYFRPSKKILAWLKKEAEETGESVSTIIRINLNKVINEAEATMGKSRRLAN